MVDGNDGSMCGYRKREHWLMSRYYIKRKYTSIFYGDNHKSRFNPNSCINPVDNLKYKLHSCIIYHIYVVKETGTRRIYISIWLNVMKL